MTNVSSRSVLQSLPKARLVELGRIVGVAVRADAPKEAQVSTLVGSRLLPFQELLQQLGRDELRAVCRAHGLDASGRARPALAGRLMEAHGATDSTPPKPLFTAHEVPRYAPRAGDIVRCRHRQWLVEEVTAPPAEGHLTAVKLVCLDDDDPGRELRVLWERELGARVIQPEAHGLGSVERIDPPRCFGAYLHALQWGAVTATDARLFQSPFRAGIQIMNHQLTPLQKALSLPRSNLFIADDVGLGKTIEAGLVLQELLLRQRVEYVLVVCPASVALQWREEMRRRFGLHFEIMNRAFLARRRQERGFNVNPWSTHHRFIISHQSLRRPEYRELLLQHVGERARKSLLILDEAHVAAPASATKYAIDSRVTRVIRDVAPRFENRLFLSATPHNGHSNSFSALLEILDRQRFTRGVPVQSASQLEPVMVRRLKEDLRQLGVERFPLRKLVQVRLRHEGGGWSRTPVTYDPSTGTHTEGEARPIGEAEPVELTLSAKLAEYTALMRPTKGRGRLVFINLQKRLLSSVEAFARTLDLHAQSVGEGRARTQLDLSDTLRASVSEGSIDDDEYGADDDTLEAEAGAEVAAASRALITPEGQARQLLDEMRDLAGRHRASPDAKALALLDWIRQHQCPGVQVGGADTSTRAHRAWSDHRVLIFTEYGDTKRWLLQLLRTAIQGTDRDDERILQLHGGMGDEQREEVQRAFNAPPDDHPVRILVATDAAREGVNLQGHCADLFHFDVPWNPARMEQRNGRIDRTLQPAPEVRCHYFIYPDRQEDLVLEKLAHKVDTIQRELGSLGAVVMDRMTEVLDRGIGDDTADALDAATEAHGTRETVKSELEAQRDDQKKLRAEIEEAGEILNRSRRIMGIDPTALREAIDVGLELAGAGPLQPLDAPEPGHPQAYELPPLPEAWQETLDTLRAPRGRDEPFWEFRKRPPLPVVFEPPPKMNDHRVHLHLSHPFVQRILGRFRAQGYSAHDLSRVTIVRTRHDSLVRVVAFGRLSLFGPGAARLHDELVSVAARWVEGSDEPLRPFAEEADRKAVDMLEKVLAESPTLDAVGQATQARVMAAAPDLFRQLWTPIHQEADARAREAINKLTARGAAESEALRDILARQRMAIIQRMEASAQLALDFTEAERSQREQFEQDQRHMEERLVRIQKEIETEPAEVQSLYQVVLHRLEPVGLVVLWPETRG